MFRHLPSPRAFRTAVVSLVVVAATSQVGSGFAAASGGSLTASTDDTRALQGSSQNDASQACTALGGTVALHEDGPFTNGNSGSGSLITYTIGQELTDPYFPGGNYSGSTPIQDVNFTYPNSVNVIGVVVKGGTDYNVYTGSSNLTGNYISPLVGGGNVANISGFWVCVGSSTLATPSVDTTVYSGTPSTGSAVGSSPLPSPASVYDTVTVSGGSGTPTGTVTFTLYDASTGNSIVNTDANVSLTNGSATSTGVTGLTAGSYYYVASYTSTGGVYSNLTGSNETFSVGLATPTIFTTPQVAGHSAYDSVTVSGTNGTPAGYVDFTLYSAAGGVVGTQDNVLLVSGSALSQSFTNLAPGNYYFVAAYLGGGGYAAVVGANEAFSIGLLPPTIVTTPQTSGTSAYDTVTVSGPPGQGTPTGSVNFTLYNANGSVAGSDSGVALSGGSATSSTFTNLAPGSYYFVATYLGDTVYGSLAGGQETFSIPKLSPTISTTPNPHGTSASDSASVTGSGGTPTGSVTFTLFAGNYPTGTPVASFGSPTVSLSGGSATSPTASGLTSGSYYFVVTYSGDTTYAAVTIGQPEPFNIIASSPPSVTKVVTTVHVVGTSATDVAIVRSPSGTPTGSVTFALYRGSCGAGSLVASYASTTALRAGVASAASTGVLRAGSYYFIATYAGSSAFSASTGSCEPFVIVRASAPKVPPYRIPAKAPHTGAGGAAQSSGGALRELGALMVALGLFGVAIAERRRRRA